MVHNSCYSKTGFVHLRDSCDISCPLSDTAMACAWPNRGTCGLPKWQTHLLYPWCHQQMSGQLHRPEGKQQSREEYHLG